MSYSSQQTLPIPNETIGTIGREASPSWKGDEELVLQAIAVNSGLNENVTTELPDSSSLDDLEELFASKGFNCLASSMLGWVDDQPTPNRKNS